MHMEAHSVTNTTPAHQITEIQHLKYKGLFTERPSLMDTKLPVLVACNKKAITGTIGPQVWILSSRNTSLQCIPNACAPRPRSYSESPKAPEGTRSRNKRRDNGRLRTSTKVMNGVTSPTSRRSRRREERHHLSTPMLCIRHPHDVVLIRGADQYNSPNQ